MAETTSFSEGAPCWADLGVPDLESAKQFYSAVLGWDYFDPGPEAGGYLIATRNGRQVAGIGPLMSPEQPIAWTIYLWSDDVDASVKLIRDAGGSITMEPMDILDQGRSALAIDPAGAAFGLWQGKAQRGAELMGEHGAFSWFELTTRDTPAARDFYSTVFGYTYEPVEGMDYHIIQVAGRQVGGIMGPMEGTPELLPHWSVYFEVDDTDVAVARVMEHDGQVLVEPEDTPYGRMAVVQDRFGAGFNLIHSAGGQP